MRPDRDRDRYLERASQLLAICLPVSSNNPRSLREG